MPFKIAITGGIASGKSTIARYLQEKKYPIIDTDQISRQLVQAKSPGLQALTQRFSRAILTVDDQLDRAKLGQIVFNDPEALQDLNAILHPLIKDEMLGQIQVSTSSIVFVEVPLLFEVGWQELFDQVWLAYCSLDQQLERLMKRDHLDCQQALKRIESQMSLASKGSLADVIIDTSGSLDDLYQQVDLALQDLENKL